MKTSTAMMALVVGLSANATTHAQLFRRNPPSNAKTVPAAAPAAAATSTDARDPNVKQSNVVIPDPVNPKDLPPPKFPLPAEPIEPYLLSRENGPFMVMAHTFKGPYAEKSAQALAMELRAKFQLPAYVFRPKDFPMRSMIRGVPPTTVRGQNRPNLAFPEMERIKDEAAVFVGNEKTEDDSEKLLHRVKKLRPVCMDYLPDWHPTNILKQKGLSRAIRTTNPYIPAEELFVRKPDVLVVQMNQGSHSLYNCPGKFSLQVAQFAGRADLGDARITKDNKNTSMMALHHSPLKTAHEDAERLAEALSKDKEVMKTGYVPYVYHDRFSSMVYMGAFNASNDPNAAKLQEQMRYLAGYLNNSKAANVLIVPATELTDVTNMKRR